MYVTPVKGKKVIEAAQGSGFGKALTVHTVRVEGSDKPGATAAIMRALAHSGISFRALSASAVGRRFVVFLALDNAEDATRAVGLLRKI
jgi:predicted amino acid-binding ACT domain protein